MNKLLRPQRINKERAPMKSQPVPVLEGPIFYKMKSVEIVPDNNGKRPQRDLSNGISEPRKWISEAEWTIDIQQSFDFDRLRSKSDVAIFKVPNFLKRSRKREVYVPIMVSLGPYHNTARALKLMKSHKERAFHRMKTRFNIVRKHANMDFSFLAKQEISHLEEDIRKMYEENNCPTKSLTGMLIFDCCFSLEILRTLGGESFPVEEAGKLYEPIFERNKIDFTGFDILNDMLKLENQIPWIVFRKLLKLELNSTDTVVEEKLFHVLVKAPSSKFYPFKYNMEELRSPQPDEQVHHLLSLLHSLIVYGPQRAGETSPSTDNNSGNDVRRIPRAVHHLLSLLHSLIVYGRQRAGETKPITDKSGNDVRRIPRAVELKNVGIIFERRDGGIKKIVFEPESGTFFLPSINITDNTEVLFSNLIALEACKASETKYVTCYVSLLDELIDTAEDVALLTKEGIVTNYLGSDAEVARLFNGLLNGVTVSRKDDFKQLKQDVDAYYRSKIKIWFAELMKEHLSSPWRSLALAAAILVLLFTAVQTVLSVLSVYK